jgi:protein-S-isoprenylcysteine O-methyltransferase Ste14
MTILKLLPLVFWLILWIYWFISAFRANKSIQTGKASWLRGFGIRLVIFVIVIFAIDYSGHAGILGNAFFNLFGQSFTSPSSAILFGSIGVILCAIGIVIAVWARVCLGRNWGVPMTLREKPELITAGPYKFVRHPIYSGFLLAMFGTAFADGPIWLLIMILAGVYFIYSAKVEEKMMLNQFPDQYPAYMKRTKMLIPFIL